MRDTGSKSGIFASLQRLLSTALEIAQVRLALIGTEVEFEKRRVFDGLLWGSVALMIFGVGLVLMCGFVILLFWDGYRLAAVGSMALLFLGAGVMLMREAKRKLHHPGGIFEASISEMDRDRAELHASGQHEER